MIDKDKICDTMSKNNNKKKRLKKAKSCNNTTESQCLVEIGVKKDDVPLSELLGESQEGKPFTAVLSGL